MRIHVENLVLVFTSKINIIIMYMSIPIGIWSWLKLLEPDLLKYKIRWMLQIYLILTPFFQLTWTIFAYSPYPSSFQHVAEFCVSIVLRYVFGGAWGLRPKLLFSVLTFITSIIFLVFMLANFFHKVSFWPTKINVVASLWLNLKGAHYRQDIIYLLVAK